MDLADACCSTARTNARTHTRQASIHIRASTTSSRIIVLVSTRHSLSALLRRARRRHLRYLKRDARGRHRCPMKAAFSIQLCLRSNLIAWILNAVWHRRTSFIPLGPSIEQSSIQPKTASSQLERKRLALAPSAAADEAAVRSSTRPSPSIPSDSCQNGPLLQYSVPRYGTDDTRARILHPPQRAPHRIPACRDATGTEDCNSLAPR